MFLWFMLLPFRLPLQWELLIVSFPLATKMFQLARLSLICPWIQKRFERLTYLGIYGSMLIFNSPQSISLVVIPCLFLVSGCLGIYVNLSSLFEPRH